MTNDHHMSISERRERIRAVRGYVTDGGIVICGACRDDAVFSPAGTPGRDELIASERYNPQAGDDWCSICDRDITGTWRAEEL